MASKLVMAVFIAVALVKAGLNFAGVTVEYEPMPHLVGQEVAQ